MMKKNKQQTLEILTTDNKFTSDIVHILQNKSIINQYKTFSKYCEKENIVIANNKIEAVKKRLQQALYNEVKGLCLIVFHGMQISDEWGPAGKTQAINTFYRAILQIEPENIMTSEEHEKAEELVKKELAKYGVNSLTKKQVDMALEYTSINMLGCKVKPDDYIHVNNILRFFDIKWIYRAGKHDNSRDYILGEASKKHLAGYDVYVFTKELLRTPNKILAEAALMGARDVFVRQLSLRNVFHLKWVPTQIGDPSAWLASYPEHNISEGIKETALKGYGISHSEEIQGIRKEFLKDCQENIIYHELAHGIVQHDLLEFEESVIADHTKNFCDCAYADLMEVLAELAPEIEKVRGPFQNIAKIARKDKEKALRMFFMYLSDVWFFDTEDKYMYGYSELIVLLLIKYIKSKNRVDFKTMETDFALNNEKNILGITLGLIKDGVAEIKKKMINHKYTFGGDEKKHDYKQIKAMVNAALKQKKIEIDLTSDKYVSAFWLAMIRLLKGQEAANKEMETFLEGKTQDIRKTLFEAVAGKRIASDYQYNIRTYIMDEMTAKGIVKT